MYFSDLNAPFMPLNESLALSGLRLEIVNGWRRHLYNLGNKDSLERLVCMDWKIAHENERLAQPNEKPDDGLLGKIAEPVFSAKFSRKRYVSKPGKPDIFIKFQPTPESPIKYIPCEFKTGNGDISALYGKGAPRFVAYCYILDNSNGRRWLEPQIMLRSDFLEMLERNDLEHGEKPDPLHPTARIRVKGQSAKLYKWLDNYCLPLNPNAVYTPDDFEEIDLDI